MTIWEKEGQEKAEILIKELLSLFGDDPSRQGLLDTPQRAAIMFAEMLEGMRYTNEEIAEQFNRCFTDEREDFNYTSGIVLMKDIPVFSFCEHHLALMYNMKVTIAYLPKDKVIGLSKLARIADMTARRLQLQEKLGEDIAHILSLIVDTQDIAVLIEGEHSCMTARGIKKPGTVTKTLTLKGAFENNKDIKNKLALLLK